MKDIPNEIFTSLKKGDRSALARAITMVESKLPDHKLAAEALLDQCLQQKSQSVRIGITGVPGVGKSTFIEAFGMYLIREHKKRVAVLAIDPSSHKSKGSILGDKTRMNELAMQDEAFIRPSPSSGSLGGVGLATRDSIALCEAAGYDVIIVETVGVGQSETEVREMVDFFLLLMLPGAGDELQGIKRGIMELADAIFINKADGDGLTKAKEAKSAYRAALRLFQDHPSGWKTRIELCSALFGEHLDLAWITISDFIELTKEKGIFDLNRQTQLSQWFRRASEYQMLSTYLDRTGFETAFRAMEEKVMQGEASPRKASRMLVEKLRG